MSLRSDVDQLWIHFEHRVLKNVIDRTTAIENGLTNIAVIRNPFDRFASQLKFLIECKEKHILDFPDIDTAEELIELIADNTQSATFTQIMRTQSSFIQDNGVVLVDKIFKLEKMSELESYLGIKMPHYNKTSIDADIPKTVKTRIQETFRDDFELYERY